MGRRIKEWNITGEVVPPGSLVPNPYKPLFTYDRRRAMGELRRGLRRHLVDACARHRRTSEIPMGPSTIFKKSWLFGNPAVPALLKSQLVVCH